MNPFVVLGVASAAVAAAGIIAAAIRRFSGTSTSEALTAQQIAAREADPTSETYTPCAECREVITPQEAQDLHDDMASQDIPFAYTRDCCNNRAERMCDLMEERGVQCRKAWAYGDLRPMNEGGTPVRFPDNDTGLPVTWVYHVAPTVKVRGDDGIVREMVIDPSMRDRPLTVEEWEGAMGGVDLRASTHSDVFTYRPDLKERNDDPVVGYSTAGEVDRRFAEHRRKLRAAAG